MPLPTDLITPKEAAAIAKTHISTIHRWIHAGRLRGWRRCGVRYLVSRADVIAALTPVEVVPIEGVRTEAEEQAAATAATERLRERGYR